MDRRLDDFVETLKREIRSLYTKTPTTWAIERACELFQEQQAESARIRNLMITEIKSTYANGEQPVSPPTIKRITNDRP